MSALGKIEKKVHLLLPHELTLVKRDFMRLAGIQQEHSELLGEAMDQSSETFHDNAPAEAIQNEQEVLMRRAKPVMFIIRQHEIIPYPEETDPVVQIGSRVGVIIDDNPAFKIDIVGYRDSDADDAEIDQVHHEALLAAALLGKVSGEATVTVIGDFEKSISIASVDQTSVREAYVQVLTEEVPLI